MTSPVPSAEFGPFRLFAAQRRLEREGEPVVLGGRALDLLILLLDNAGNVVAKQDLIAGVWPDTTVEESSLRVHIAGLRKALGDGRGNIRYVANVAGRGYCFVGEVTRRDVVAGEAEPPVTGGLPQRPTCVIGRDGDVRAISDLLAQRRFVTIHGPGGIGKTTVAVALAHTLAREFADGSRFLDLGLRTAPDPVPEALAAALGLMVPSNNPAPSILNHLRDRQMLLVFDCCEHVIQSAAALAETIYREAPRIRILATSREPLRAEGEHVYPLASLGVPPEGLALSAEPLLNYPAARLFLERAAAGGYRARLSDDDAHVVADICRKVDGIALALELAAGRVSAHGLRETATLLDSRLTLSWQGRRTALPRHQTLNATLDWSHALIAKHERIVLRRLSVFVGPFSLEEARAVAHDGAVDGAEAVEALAQLVAKSLVVADTRGPIARYRLLDTTRAYARARLGESGEEAAVRRRHATFYADRLMPADDAPAPESEGRIGTRHLGNIRAALDWSFSDVGDAALGIRIATGAAPLFLDDGLLAECRLWTERAVAALGTNMIGSRFELELRTALGCCLMFTEGNSEEARTALQRALDVAEALGDRFHQFQAISGLHMYHCRMGDFDTMSELAPRAAAIAPELANQTALADADVIMGATHHLAGRLEEAHAALTRATQHAVQAGDRPNLFGYHREAPIFVARNLWLQGFPERALATAREAERTERKNPVTTCLALIWNASVFHLCGDWAAVESMADRLIRQASDHALEPYRAVGAGFRGGVLLERGETEAGVALLRDSLHHLRTFRYELYTPWSGCMLAVALARRGHIDQALGLIEETIEATGRNADAHNMPELLRLRGDLLARAGNEQGAERSLHEALAGADTLGALSWRLRAATSLCRLHLRQGRREEAREALAASYARFTEGFETADLQAARHLLDELERAAAGPSAKVP